MLKSYLKIALRNLRKEKGYAIINVTGLSIGLAVCLLVMAYVTDEWSFDKFHANADRLFRINKVVSGSTGTVIEANTPFPLADLIKDNIPETEAVEQVIPMVGGIVSGEGKALHEMITFADPQFFQIFTFPLRHGEAGMVLADPSSVVVTSSFAEQMFGCTDVVGRRLQIGLGEKTNDFLVSGVAADPPHNSSLGFQLVVPMGSMNRYFRSSPSWSTSWPETYMLVRNGVDLSEVQQKLNTAGKIVPRKGGSRYDWQFQMQPISGIHLHPEVQGSVPNTHSPMYCYLLCLIAFVVLELACINFTTLAIGRAQRRVREMGTRKVMGASSKQIIAQVLGETLVIAAISMLVAYVLAELLLPHFGNLAGKSFGSIMTATGNWSLLAFWFVVIAALFAGCYPALILSRVRMVEALKGRANLLTGQVVTRFLIVLQFAISATLVIVTLCMLHQLDYVIKAPLGFDKESLLMIRLDGTALERMALVSRLRESLTSSDGVLSVAASSSDFTGGGLRKGGKVGPDSSDFSVFVNPVDYAYAKTMGLTLTRGNDFSSTHAAAGGANVLVNETLVREMQWDDPIGKEAPLLEGTRIVGIVKDFNIQPFTSQIEPVVLLETKGNDDGAESIQYALVKLRSENISEAVTHIEKTWRQIAPNFPFDYQFMDAHIASQYRNTEQWANIVRDSALLAVLVACFGVFGLTTLATSRRRKELGIRKVLGAKVRQLAFLFLREFSLLSLIGNLVAWPLAYYFANRWLAVFVYRDALSPWSFVVALLLLIGIVILTVSIQAIRAAAANPADVIRYE